jgi:hypothetical protein
VVCKGNWFLHGTGHGVPNCLKCQRTSNALITACSDSISFAVAQYLLSRVAMRWQLGWDSADGLTEKIDIVLAGQFIQHIEHDNHRFSNIADITITYLLS